MSNSKYQPIGITTFDVELNITPLDERATFRIFEKHPSEMINKAKT